MLTYFLQHSPASGPSHRENKLLQYVGKAVEVLRQQNGIICATHPNANIYTMLSSLVEFDGFYLESDPCLVCNNPEVPFAVCFLNAQIDGLGENRLLVNYQ